ncbi:MAG: OmpA family protein [Candidatus Hydrogenedentota bacterium]
MKSITPFVMVSAVAILLTGCQTKQDNARDYDNHRVAHVEVSNKLHQDPVNQAIITTSTIFTHHFVTHTPTLNELGMKDLDVLADHYINDVMPVSMPVNIVSDVHVYFDYDKSDIRPDNIAALEAAIKVLGENPDANILITGRTDIRGTDDYNIALGNRRANAVDSYMAANGIDPTRIRILSRGEMDALSAETSEEGMQKDRNAHFVVAEVNRYPLPLNVRQGGASDDLYRARKKNTLAYLAEKGVDTSLLRIADDFAGGEGLAAEQVVVIVTYEAPEGDGGESFTISSGGGN